MQRGKSEERAPLHNIADIKDDSAVLDAPEKPPETSPVKEPNENEPHIVNANV